MSKAKVTALTALVIASCVAFTQPWENTKYVAYRDIGGVWTICDGVTYIDGKRVQEGQTATKSECQKFTEAAHKVAGDAVLRLTVPLPLETFNAVEDFVYNVGATAYANSTMRRLFNQGAYGFACEEFPKWKFAAGKDCTVKANKCGGIPARREDERQQCWRGLQ